MQIAILGVDLGKNSCSVVGLDDSGRVVVRRRMHRVSVIKFAGGLSPCLVAMEACCVLTISVGSCGHKVTRFG
jgi:transposase